MLSSARTSARSTARKNAEIHMVQRREREHDHQLKWNNQVRYYKSCEKLANKFDDWTSPRYYETSNKQIEQLKSKQQHKDKLEKRREKLKKLLEEENRTYQIELMVRNRSSYLKQPEVSTSVLKEVNSALKLEDEDRRKHEAELALYHQWRKNNPIVREHERKRNLKDLKLSWLDQQIEKRLERERAEEECRKQVEERNRMIDEEKQKEEVLQKLLLDKKEKLRADLEKQMAELSVKEEQSARLQEDEDRQEKQLFELGQLENERLEIERRNRQREVALENLKMHKMRLKQKADYVRETLESEKAFVKNLLDSEIADRIENELKRDNVKVAMKEFLKFARDQQDLEKKRRQHFDFVFDSEAKLVYEKQRDIWFKEEMARQALLQDVLDTVKQQIDDNVRKNKDMQRQVLEERQSSLKLLEEYDASMRKNQEEEERRKRQWKKEIDLQIREKKAKEAELKSLYRKQQDLELEKVRKEEERLQREIVELQRRQGPVRHARSRIIF